MEELSGLLQVQKEAGLRKKKLKWKEHWFCIVDDNLCYFTSQDRAKLRGAQPVVEIQSIFAAGSNDNVPNWSEKWQGRCFGLKTGMILCVLWCIT